MKKKSCRQDHICLIALQSTKLMVFSMLRRSCCCASWPSRCRGYLFRNTTQSSTHDYSCRLCRFLVARLLKTLKEMSRWIARFSHFSCLFFYEIRYLATFMKSTACCNTGSHSDKLSINHHGSFICPFNEKHVINKYSQLHNTFFAFLASLTFKVKWFCSPLLSHI